MISFKDFLSEEIAKGSTAPSYKSLNVSAAVALLNSKCKDSLWMLETNHPIYRGDNVVLHDGFATVDPSLTKRKSANTRNFYTEIFDHTSSWKDFPKRSNSFIASFTKSYADGYAMRGAAMVLIPFDKVEIGCVNKSDLHDVKFDLWDATCNLPKLNYRLGDAKIKDDWKSISAFQQQLKNGNADALSKLRSKISKRADPNTFLSDIDSGLSPANLGFTKFTTKNLPQKQRGEVWVNGPCVLITIDMWKLMRKAIKE